MLLSLLDVSIRFSLFFFKVLFFVPLNSGGNLKFQNCKKKKKSDVKCFHTCEMTLTQRAAACVCVYVCVVMAVICGFEAHTCDFIIISVLHLSVRNLLGFHVFIHPQGSFVDLKQAANLVCARDLLQPQEMLAE